jgi:hypothetical protein
MDTLKQKITASIITEFWRMYGGNNNRVTGMNELDLEDSDCDEAKNSSIATGITELMSDQWRFEQTPRFDFASGTVDNHELRFQAYHGVLQHLTLSKQGSVIIKKDEDDFRHEPKLHEIRDWSSILARPSNVVGSKNSGDVPVALVSKVEAIFPPFVGVGHEQKEGD